MIVQGFEDASSLGENGSKSVQIVNKKILSSRKPLRIQAPWPMALLVRRGPLGAAWLPGESKEMIEMVGRLDHNNFNAQHTLLRLWLFQMMWSSIAPPDVALKQIA